MKRFSVYFLFGITIITAITIYDYYSNVLILSSRYNKSLAKRVNRLNEEALVAKLYYTARPDARELSEFLESRRHLESLDFWALVGPTQEIVKTSIAPTEMTAFQFDLHTPNTSISSPSSKKYFYAVEHISDGSSLVVGLRQAKEEFIETQFSKVQFTLVRYLIGLCALSFAVFAFYFRDIQQSIREVSRGGRKSFGKIQTHSREAEILIRGLESYDQRTGHLKQEKELLIWQVLPSLRTELMSGRTPPYEFDCTLVRADINNFTKIYNENPVEPFTSTIHEFFTDVSHVVARYHGLIHEFIGDEVIFYFKDENCGNSVLAALSAIRDIHSVAERYNEMTLGQRGYPFTIKSTFAHGRLRFGKFVNGYNIAGPSLIETVRILSHVHEKDGNVIVFDARHLDAIEDAYITKPYATVHLKGFQGEKHLVACLSRRHSIEEMLTPSQSTERGTPPEFLRYCRSDDDIASMLTWAKKASQSQKPDYTAVIMELISVIRQVPVTQTNGIPQQLLISWIDELLIEANGPFSLRVLPTLIRLAQNLFPKSQYSRDLDQVLRTALTFRDPRVVANAVETLAHFQTDYEPNIGELLARHTDNRITANAIIYEGLHEISSSIIKKLRTMLTSKSAAEIASGLYAYGEISLHHRSKDPVYYRTQVQFQKLSVILIRLVQHDDAKVKRQLFSAVKKVGDDSLTESIWKAVFQRANSDPDLVALATQHLGEPKGDRQKAA